MGTIFSSRGLLRRSLRQLSFKLRNADSVRNLSFGALILRIDNLTKQNFENFFSILFQKMLFSIISIELQSEKNTIITGTLSQILLFSLPPLKFLRCEFTSFIFTRIIIFLSRHFAVTFSVLHSICEIQYFQLAMRCRCQF